MENIKNVIIFDGDKEFSSIEIFQNSDLINVYTRTITFKGLSTLIEKINSENGLLYINIDKELTIGKVQLKNISTSLQKEYSKIID